MCSASLHHCQAVPWGISSLHPSLQCTSSFASHPPHSRDLQVLAYEPWCSWPRDEIHSMYQSSALPSRQRQTQTQEKGKTKAQDTKALISTDSSWDLLGRWLNTTTELSKVTKYQIHLWAFRLNWSGLIFISGKYLGPQLNTQDHLKQKDGSCLSLLFKLVTLCLRHNLNNKRIYQLFSYSLILFE